MSLDVYLVGPRRWVSCHCNCGHAHKAAEKECFFGGNITHNLAAMAKAANLYYAMWRPEEIGAKLACHIEPALRLGLEALKAEPERFRAHNPENGWGSYEGLVDFVGQYLEACRKHPKARIEVSR